MAKSRALGLRTQIIVALAALMLVAFGALYFAVASLALATLREARQEAALALGRAVAAHVGEIDRAQSVDAVKQRLEAHIGQEGVSAIAVYDGAGHVVAAAGGRDELALVAAPPLPFGESSRTVRGAHGRALEVIVPQGDRAIVTRVRIDDIGAQAAPLVQLVAMYVASFALALMVFAYLALTRLIVRPIDALVHAADRVAGARVSIDLPRTGPREIRALSASLGAMTVRLATEQEALRSKVQELTTTTRLLTDMQSQLVRTERMASVGRLAAGVAHEIGNPLAAIMGMQELLLDDDLPLDERHDFLGRMTRETERIHQVLRDLLDFARPEKLGRGAAEADRPALVAKVVDDVLGLVRPQRVLRGIDLQSAVDDPNISVALAPGRLTQVVLNLVLNAADAIAATNPGLPARITVRARRDEASVVIEVEDDGPGVPAAMHDRLFEPFVTSKEVGKGTGLGLAVCRGIIESAHGDIALDVSYGGGARFVIRLPAAVEI